MKNLKYCVLLFVEVSSLFGCGFVHNKSCLSAKQETISTNYKHHANFKNGESERKVYIESFGPQKIQKERSFELYIFLTNFDYNFWRQKTNQTYCTGSFFYDAFFGPQPVVWFLKWAPFKKDIQEKLKTYSVLLGLYESALQDALKDTFSHNNDWYLLFQGIFKTSFRKTYTFKAEKGYNYYKKFREDGVILGFPFAPSPDQNGELTWHPTSGIKIFPQTDLIVNQTIIMNYFWHVQILSATETNIKVSITYPLITINAPTPGTIRNYLASIYHNLFYDINVSQHQEDLIKISEDDLQKRVPISSSEAPTLFHVIFYQKSEKGVLQVYDTKDFLLHAQT